MKNKASLQLSKIAAVNKNYLSFTVGFLMGAVPFVTMTFLTKDNINTNVIRSGELIELRMQNSSLDSKKSEFEKDTVLLFKLNKMEKLNLQVRGLLKENKINIQPFNVSSEDSNLIGFTNIHPIDPL